MKLRSLTQFLLTLLIICHGIYLPETEAYIQVVEHEGVWWFKDESGNRFFSLGVNCVGGCFGHAEDQPMDRRRKSWIVSFLKDLGFNTVACWSSPSLWDTLYFAEQIYTGFRENRDDVFDGSLWRDKLEPCIREEVKPFIGKKNFIGYFLDNEREWKMDELFKFYLALPKGKPGSIALVSFLESYYQGSIAELNKDWGSSCRSFSSLAAASLPKSYNMQNGILSAWQERVAETYYARYASFVRSLDPNHLILGIRYRGLPDVGLLKTLSPYFDVNSVNDYNRYGHLRPEYEALYKASGKPLMITEYSFSGFAEPGFKSKLFVDVYTQANRGRGYAKYVRAAARAPFMLGMHWFSWKDYPEGNGSGDYLSPDENVGIMSNDESKSYEELTRRIRETNAEVHSLHSTGRVALPAKQPIESIKVVRFRPVMDGDLREWPQPSTFTPFNITSLKEGESVHDTYFISTDGEAIYIGADIADSRIELPEGEWYWQGDHLFLHLQQTDSSRKSSEDSLILCVSPVGDGPNRNQPTVIRWYAPQQHQTVSVPVAGRKRPGGYTIELQIPGHLIPGGMKASRWRFKVGYQNVNQIYRNHWEGLVWLDVE